YVSRRPCKLSLARYLFGPAEVASWVLEQVRSSPGLSKQSYFSDFRGEPLGEPAPSIIGDFDQALASHLRKDSRVLWVGERTSAELNSLVEYPLGTVAIVIKPPGSDLEFEVKRAGLRGPHALDAVYERNGKQLPVPHRLQGGSLGQMLDYEAYASG